MMLLLLVVVVVVVVLLLVVLVVVVLLVVVLLVVLSGGERGDLRAPPALVAADARHQAAAFRWVDVAPLVADRRPRRKAR